MRYFSLILSAIVLNFSPLWACSYAYQYSLFPLGISGNKLLLIEVEMERYVNTPDAGIPRPRYERSTEISVRWKGNLKLRGWNIQTGALEGEILADIANQIDIDDKTYQEELRPYFQQAYETAEKMPFFKPASLPEVGNCRYDISCDFLKKEIDTIAPNLYFFINKESYKDKKLKVEFPPILLQKFENMSKQNFSDLETVANQSQVEYFKSWKAHSVRIYEINGLKFAFYSFGWGQRRFYTGTKSTDWEFPTVGNIGEYVEGNDVLFHGQRFDMVQIL